MGAAVGGGGGAITKMARERGWLTEELGGPAVLVLALAAYASALTIDGNGFVAAFVGGLVFGNVAGRGGEKEVYFVDQTGSMASMVSWLVFGALAVPVISEAWSWTMLLYAALSLTVVRMLPVAVALLGAGFDRFSVAFIGWFGPRGLASVIFALIALEGLHERRNRGRGGHLTHRRAQRRRPRVQCRAARQQVHGGSPRRPASTAGTPPDRPDPRRQRSMARTVGWARVATDVKKPPARSREIASRAIT